MTEQQIVGYATIGGFILAFVLVFAVMRVRYWKRAFLEQVAQNQQLLDRPRGSP